MTTNTHDSMVHDMATADDRTVVFVPLETHNEPTDVLDASDYTLHLQFETPEEAWALADQFSDCEVVRVTIETEARAR